MEKYNITNKTDIKMHNVVFETISQRGCDVERLLLLEYMPNTSWDEFVLAEGAHCSCYDFDETEWNCIKLTWDELNKLLKNIGEHETLRKELKEFLAKY